ncbi:hypothetical protein INF35_04505 [Subdoligranulum sp. DSM 109015]|uniref:Uncharacterized protein n=1 Tax=Gemmiger gallinarum TaxID=2779354 RepID=A0ABR9R1L8_9FIRM|nr:hypothetical protein [Gemmiger gallinarum]
MTEGRLALPGKRKLKKQTFGEKREKTSGQKAGTSGGRMKKQWRQLKFGRKYANLSS